MVLIPQISLRYVTGNALQSFLGSSARDCWFASSFFDWSIQYVMLENSLAIGAKSSFTENTFPLFLSSTQHKTQHYLAAKQTFQKSCLRWNWMMLEDGVGQSNLYKTLQTNLLPYHLKLFVGLGIRFLIIIASILCFCPNISFYSFDKVVFYCCYTILQTSLSQMCFQLSGIWILNLYCWFSHLFVVLLLFLLVIMMFIVSFFSDLFQSFLMIITPSLV